MAGWSILANGSSSDSAKNVGTSENKSVVITIDDDDDNVNNNDIKDDKSEDTEDRSQGLFLANGSGSDSAEKVSTSENKIVIIIDDDDDESEDSEVRLRGLFDEIVSLFVKAIVEKGVFMPLPAILDCDREPVDLFRLFSIVRGKGGYASVTENKLWGFVARELGLWVRASASVKLVYFKYLSEFEKWVLDRKSIFREDFGPVFLSSELEAAFRALLPKVSGGDDEDRGNENVDDTVVVEKGKDCKRKRESLSEMMTWLKEMAKLPGDRPIGTVGDVSEVKQNDGKVFVAQAIRARETLLLRRHVHYSFSNNEETNSQKKPKMHPSMYEDRGGSSERLRFSKRVPIAVKSRLCPCCNKSNPHKPEPENEPELGETTKSTPPPASDAEPLPGASDERSGEEPAEEERHVSVGPGFQAEVPEWTGGRARESDPKWLGTRVWPPPERAGGGESPPAAETVGKGRRGGFCQCPFPGSGECVRFHVAEARTRLKLELGAAFFRWRFHRMGEEVSLGWSLEEETKFRDVVRSSSSNNNKSFGDRRVWFFLKKTRESIISYYFNVFLVRKRSYQNRVTLREADSDDDETEFGSIGGQYGNGSADLSGPVCLQNKQCSDPEETEIG